MPKISQIDEVPCQAEVRILQKITLKHAVLVSQINIIKNHGSRRLPKSRFTRKRKVISQFTGNKTSNSRFTKIPFTTLLDCVKILDSAAPTRYQVKLKESMYIKWEKPDLYRQVKHINLTLSIQMRVNASINFVMITITKFSNLIGYQLP